MSISYFFRGNLAPVINSLTVNPLQATVNAPINFTCSATDLDGSVASVEYFMDGVSRGVSTAQPNFSLNYSPTTTGSNRLVAAQATDNLGAKSLIFSTTVLNVSGANTAPGQMAPPTGIPNSASSIPLSYVPPNTGGLAILDYVYTYSSDGGSTFSAFAHAANTTLSQVITGLLPGTAYQFRVAATNSIGTGLASASYLVFTPPSVVGVTFSGDAAQTAAMPAITSFSPASGPVGTVIILTGTGFGANAGTTGTVKLGGLLTYPSAWADTSITLAVPTGANSGFLVVTTAGGTATSSTVFTVSAAATGGNSYVVDGYIQDGYVV